MTHFLRLFASYRALEAEAARLSDEMVRLQDRVEAAENERARVWEELQKSLENERTAYRMHINERWQREYGTIPHPDAPHLPDTQMRQQTGGPIPLRRTFGGSAVNQAEKRFRDEYLRRFGEAKESGQTDQPA